MPTLEMLEWIEQHRDRYPVVARLMKIWQYSPQRLFRIGKAMDEIDSIRAMGALNMAEPENMAILVARYAGKRCYVPVEGR